MHKLCLTAALLATVGLAQSLLLRPEYSEASIVNAASGTLDRIAPNTILSIYGSNLAFQPWAISPKELLNPALPTATPGEDVIVSIDGVRMPLFYVSSRQINVLVHPEFSLGRRTLVISRGIVTGDPVRITLAREAPEIFRMPDGFAAATHTDGRVVNVDHPAEAGEVIVAYGTGFGPLRQEQRGVVVPTRPIEVTRFRDYRVKLNGEALPASSILYVGVTPGFAGLYQINFRLPEELPGNPTLEIGLDENWSMPDLRLFTTKIATP